MYVHNTSPANRLLGKKSVGTKQPFINCTCSCEYCQQQVQFDEQKATTGSCINYAADIGPAADKVLFVYPTTIKWLCNLRFQMFYIKIITCLPLKNNLCILGGTSNGPSSFFRSSSIFVSLLRLSTCALLLPSIVLTWIHMMTAIKSTKR